MSRLVRAPASLRAESPRNLSGELNQNWKTRDPSAKRTFSPDGLRASWQNWRTNWKNVFTTPGLSTDLLSGLTVAAVALPLNVALAVACGLPPSVGLVSGAIGGAVAALFGGAPLQATGPAAALGVMVLALVTRWGVAGAAAGAICVGLIQYMLYSMRAGRFMRFVPEAVLAGFTTGVGLKLLDQQIPLLFDVNHGVVEMFRSISNPVWLHEVRWTSVVAGLTVILFMLGLAKYRKLPAAIFGLGLVAFVSNFLGWEMLRVGEVPAALPVLSWPNLPATEWVALFFTCIPLGVLAAAESLLSAKAVDRMRPDGKPHDANQEVFGQASANLASGLFGGMPVSGVIVRSSVNVQAGAKTRVSTLIHAGLLLMAPLYFGNFIALLPLAALAGLLCLVGYRLVEVSTLVHLYKEKPRYAIAFLVAAAGVVTGELSWGLIAALLIAGVPDWIAERNQKRRNLAQVAAKPVLPPGVKASLPGKKIDLFSRGERPIFRAPEEDWQAHVAGTALVHPTAFVHPNASIIGRVVLGPHVHVASEAAIRADEGTPFYIGERTNVQDGVVLHALKGKWVLVGGEKWAIHVGERVSLAHQALVHGPCYIGNDTFVGFKAIVHDAIVGDGCSVGIGAIVVGVEVPSGRYVPHGSLVDTQEKAAALPPVQPHHRHFNEDVVEVNHGLAAAYHGVGAAAPLAQNH